MRIHSYDGNIGQKERELPLYTVTLGDSRPQTAIHRPAGINDYQLLYTCSGVGVVRIREREYEVCEGDLFILPPFTPHEYYPKGDDWITLWVTYNGSVAKTCFDFSAGIKKHADFEAAYKRLKRFKGREDWRKKTSPELYALLLGLSLLGGFTPEEAQIGGNISAAVQYIAEHYAETVELSRLAEISGLSEGHFCRVFKQHTHMRPIEYVTYLRVERAKDLLLSRPPLSISEIARKLGYTSAAYFSKIFREKVGVTPEEYRKI